MKRIEEIRIKRFEDEIGEIDHLGEFSDNKAAKYAIKHSNMPGEYKYFNADNVSNMKEARQNYERAVSYGRGWSMVGIRAEAVVQTSEDGKYWTTQVLTSGGLYGIESDSDNSYFKSVEGEELADLEAILQQFGFEPEEIEVATAAMV